VFVTAGVKNLKVWDVTSKKVKLGTLAGRFTRHTSHVTRHTSHVTRHTSHVTRHTSHVTLPLFQVTRPPTPPTCAWPSPLQRPAAR
jgi:hypothetical protein